MDLALCRSELAARTQLVDDGAIRNGLAESTDRNPTPLIWVAVKELKLSYHGGYMW